MEQTWKLADFGAALASDWSPYHFLVLELKLSAPQRFELRIHDEAGVRAVRLSPVPGVWIRTAVPLAMLTEAAHQGNDLASVHNKARPLLFLNLMGAPGELKAVREIGVFLPDPVGSVTVEIRALALAKTDPGDTLLDAKPLVDELGQWIHATWPGKAETMEQLRAAWSNEDKSLAAAHAIYCPYGGFTETKAKATGFFRVEKIEGAWWLVDPDGHLFFSTGADSIGTSVATPVTGREGLFASLPPDHNASTDTRGGASFYSWNLERRFGPNWGPKWVDLTVRRMTAWGFNTVGNWSDARLGESHRIPYTDLLRGWGIESGPMGVVDVYAPDFAQRVERIAKEQCEPHKSDPWLLGYFLGNEPPWPGRETVAADAILHGPASPLQAALQAFLADGDTAERRRDFLYQTYAKFVEAATAAIRKHDPNHLTLGLRFGSAAPAEIVGLSRVFDVYSLNSYAYTANPREIAKVRDLIDKPILIGEFHFGTPGRGMTPGLKQAVSQEERGVAYRYYVENAAADPSLVGAHWFEWVDEPSTGRFDGENYNIGLVDVTDQPYGELVEAARETHLRLADIHAGRMPPVTRQAKVR